MWHMESKDLDSCLLIQLLSSPPFYQILTYTDVSAWTFLPAPGAQNPGASQGASCVFCYWGHTKQTVNSEGSALSITNDQAPDPN